MPASLGISLPNRGVMFGAITVDEILEMSEVAERSGAFDSVWVGDSLLAKPRLERAVGGGPRAWWQPWPSCASDPEASTSPAP